MATLTATLTTLTTTLPVGATPPEQARVDNILGNSSELLIRRSGRRESIQVGSVLQQIRDALITAPPNNARALLRFLSGSGEDLNFYVQTNPHAEAAIYYFPCQMQGGDYLIGWGLANAGNRGCENGMQVMRGRTAAQAEPVPVASHPLASGAIPNSGAAGKQAGPVRQIFYCGASGSSGVGFATTTGGDPCTTALQQCEGGDCDVTNTGFWWSSEPDIQATLACDDGTSLTAAATGETLAGEIEGLVTQAGARSCGLQVYRGQDLFIVPASDAVVQAGGDDEILVQARDTDAGLTVEVIKGAINVQSAAEAAPVLVQQGQRYTYGGMGGAVADFNRGDSLTSVDMEVLCTFTAGGSGLRVSACEEAGLATDEPVAFCDREQASGGQEGDRRMVQMSANSGEIEIDYTMYTVPDRLQVFYEGKALLDTDFVSGTETVRVPFSGSSARVEVVVTGNIEQSSTQWEYTLRCPR
ncbi:MAG: hypothetical protein AAFZ80_07600 [Cyanobacteria bacterium P01_A01_bin.105]